MSAKTLIDLGVQTSPTALDAIAEPTWAARPRLADAEMGDSSSQAALERLNQAVSELKALTIAPLLAEAMRRISDESSVSSLFD